MKILVVSLRKDGKRRKFIKAQLDALGLEFEFFDAMLGSEKIGDTQWYDDEQARRQEGRSLKPGEVGCALSHIGVYEEIVRRNLPYALILEDDAIVHKKLPKVLECLENGLIAQGDLIFLERCDHYAPFSVKKLFDDFKLVNPILVRHGNNAQSAGYIVTRDAARAMKDVNIPVHFPADNWGNYAGLVRFKGVVPTLTLIRQQVSLGSTIAAGDRKEFTPYSIKDLLWNSFKTYTPVGRHLKRAAKKFLTEYNKKND
jgi:glycosyl transferase family 25